MELFFLLPIPSAQDLKHIAILSTIAFLVAPLFLLLYIFSYNRRKKVHLKEKALMKFTFDAEILKSQIEVQEHIMQTIAAELHDNIGQLLGLTSFTLGSVSIPLQPIEQERVETAKELVIKATKELRQLAKLMQGEQLIVTGLDGAIKAELNWLSRNGTIKVNYTNSLKSKNLIKPEKELMLFRIFQEVVNNVIKHANASKLKINLFEKGNEIILTITDNGNGFHVKQIKEDSKGMGLGNLEKRTQMMGGNFEVWSEIGQGTIITIRIPRCK